MLAMSATSRCKITISMVQDLPPTRAEYRSLWYAAVAIIEMCVRQGRSGIATELGELPKFRITLLKSSC